MSRLLMTSVSEASVSSSGASVRGNDRGANVAFSLTAYPRSAAIFCQCSSGEAHKFKYMETPGIVVATVILGSKAKFVVLFSSFAGGLRNSGPGARPGEG
jgi:hypothetical protein